MNYLLCGPRRYPYTPYHYGYWKFQGGWGSQSQNVLKKFRISKRMGGFKLKKTTSKITLGVSTCIFWKNIFSCFSAGQILLQGCGK